MWRRRRKLAPPDLGPYTYAYAPEFPEPPPEPWRLGPYGGVAVLLGVDVLVDVADPSRLQKLAQVDNGYLNELESDIKENGVKESLILIVDSMGRVCMKEGHHRTIVAGRLGLTGLPVRFEASEGRVRYGRPLSGVLAGFLQTAAREATRA